MSFPLENWLLLANRRHMTYTRGTMSGKLNRKHNRDINRKKYKSSLKESSVSDSVIVMGTSVQEPSQRIFHVFVPVGGVMEVEVM